MSLSNLSLEELEARCETLQRRVQDRGSNGTGSAMRSPPRPYSGAGPTHTASSASFLSSSAVQQSQPTSPTRLRATSPSISRAAAAPISQSAPPPPPVSPPALAPPSSNAGEDVLSPSQITAAIAALEAQRASLEEQLRQVGTHLCAYRQLQRAQYAQAAPAALRSIPNPYQVPSAAPQPTPLFADTSVVSASNASSVGTGDRGLSPSRHRSPPRAFTAATPSSTSVSTPAQPSGGSASSLQTEEIYRELQAIRKAREEREAQRRAALQAAATPQR